MVARSKDDILKAKGVKPTLSPNLNTLAIVEALDVKRLLFIGVGCQVIYVHQCGVTTLNNTEGVMNTHLQHRTAPSQACFAACCLLLTQIAIRPLQSLLPVEPQTSALASWHKSGAWHPNKGPVRSN